MFSVPSGIECLGFDKKALAQAKGRSFHSSTIMARRVRMLRTGFACALQVQVSSWLEQPWAGYKDFIMVAKAVNSFN